MTSVLNVGRAAARFAGAVSAANPNSRLGGHAMWVQVTSDQTCCAYRVDHNPRASRLSREEDYGRDKRRAVN
jgi:hypothetical protein